MDRTRPVLQLIQICLPHIQVGDELVDRANRLCASTVRAMIAAVIGFKDSAVVGAVSIHCEAESGVERYSSWMFCLKSVEIPTATLPPIWIAFAPVTLFLEAVVDLHLELRKEQDKDAALKPLPSRVKLFDCTLVVRDHRDLYTFVVDADHPIIGGFNLEDVLHCQTKSAI